MAKNIRQIPGKGCKSYTLALAFLDRTKIILSIHDHASQFAPGRARSFIYIHVLSSVQSIHYS